MRRGHAVIKCLALGILLSGCSPATVPTAPKPPEAVPTAQQNSPAAQNPVALSPTPKQVEQTRYGGVLTICTAEDPISLDLAQEQQGQMQHVVQLGYNGVTQFDPDNPEQVIGDLAKNWEVSGDGTAYIFNLHQNVKFHDGTPFTSEDVKFSFERMTNPPQGVRSARRADLAAIDRVETPDQKTAKFVLKYPSSSLLDVISSGWMGVYSKAFVEKKGHMKNEVMGTGPFKFKSYAAGTLLEYVRNPDYFVKGRPYLDGITFYVLKDAATRLAAFRTGQVKLTGVGTASLTPADAETIKKTAPQINVEPYTDLGFVVYMVNTEKKPWTDVRVRQAAHLAIDRELAISVLARGSGVLGSWMPGKWGIPKEDLVKMPGWRQPKDLDLAEARKLLAEAGYPEGFSVKALVRTGRVYEDIAVFMADQLAKVGIKLEMELAEPAVRETTLAQGNFSFHSLLGSLALPDPQNTARYWNRPLGDVWGQNQQRSSDEKIWDLFDKQARAIDPAERRKVVRELDLRIIELAARPIVYWRRNFLGMWPEVKNRKLPIGDYSFNKYQDVWLAK